MTATSFRIIPSPLGDILLRAEEATLTGVFFAGQKYYPAAGVALREDRAAAQVFDRAQAELADYFGGRRHDFTVPLAPAGSDFQRRVWNALRALRFGEVVSYGELARRAGLESRHARAVGAAVGRNPLSVIVPCHRVLGASGALTGYAGGPERKMSLLALEGVAEKVAGGTVTKVES